ncbi:MAG: DoxX family protein [Flavobacteriaceae bacterium]
MDHFTSFATEIFLLIFLAIVFLQSGVDKIMDWKGNLSWLTGHFSKTILKGAVPLLLGTILLAEIATGALSVMGVYEFLCIGESSFAFYAATVAAITLLLLLFGQRIAKDYEGAKTIVIYLIPTLFLVFLLQ